jgi:arylsulfatase
MKKSLSVIIGLLVCMLVSAQEKPNILLIIADDMGYSDIGCYGGEIATPNIDRLANEGLRFQTFYNMAKCNPTRSSMLTGLYKGGKGAVHLANLTKQAGYYNIMSGKEHFDDWVPDYCKAHNVFDHSLWFWATTEYFLPPSGKYERSFYLEGKEISAQEIEHEKSPMYKTDFVTDYALRWLDEAFEKESPFFLYLPYHVAHWPLQARPEDIALYRGKYIRGWDKMRDERYKRMQELGVIPKNTKLSAAEGNLNKLRGAFTPDYINYYPWEGLSEQSKDSLELEMAVYAAMIHRMDLNIGRVFEKLEKEGKLKNTIVMFLIDNGACPFDARKIKDVQPGPANSYWCMRTSWGNFNNTPYRQFKQTGYNGGSNSPFIVRWPGVIKPNTITGQPGHVVDIAPTFLDILEIEYPETINGYKTQKLHGQTLMPIFKGEQREQPSFFMSGLNKHRMYREGDYTICRLNGDEWQLYNVIKDPSQTNDLSTKEAGILKQMIEAYDNNPSVK